MTPDVWKAIGFVVIILGATWRLSAVIKGLSMSVTANTERTDAMHTTMETHNSTCNETHIRTEGTLENHGEKLTDLGKRVSAIELG